MKSKRPKIFLKIGMMWIDETKKKDFVEIIGEATSYYFFKYGLPPDLCHIHPEMLDGKKIERISTEFNRKDGTQAGTMDITLVIDKTILKHHVWIGVVR